MIRERLLGFSNWINKCPTLKYQDKIHLSTEIFLEPRASFFLTSAVSTTCACECMLQGHHESKMASSAPSGEAIASPTLESIPVQGMAALDVKDPVTEAVNEAAVPETQAAEVPPHRSHDPTNNLKRSDPFQFGSRYLNEGDDVFEFNAWDHVETDDAYKEYAEEQYAKQRQHPVSDFEKSKSPTQNFTQRALPSWCPDDTQPMHSSSESTEDKLYLLILSLPSDLHHILIFLLAI